MSNFVNDAVFGKTNVGQDSFFADLKVWWDGLDQMYRYAIIGGAGLFAVLVVLAIVRPIRAAGEMAEMRELLKLRMMKELA